MEKKFDCKEWEARCRTCFNARFSKVLNTVVCSKPRGVECEYVKKDGPLTNEYSEKIQKKKQKTGKVCPGCGIWYPYSEMKPNKTNPVTGTKYYTYCNDCKKNRFKKVRE